MARRVTVIPARQTRHELETRKKLRVACYCRVSTDHEDQEGSFRNQVEYYTNLINNKEDWTLAGVFADEGISGTGTRHRLGFMDMIQACERGDVDYVITKSVSRFARNTADSLLYSRRLKNLGIPVFFEKENVNTMDSSGELMFTILSSLAQEESRNISENTQWGIRSKFQQGVPHLNTECLLGYDKDEDGNLVINEEQAKVVRRIYREFLEGWEPSEISNHLNEDGVPGVHGEPRWHAVTIERILRNEKHVGDLLLQKSYTADFLSKTRNENDGELEQYFVKDNHEGIIKREDWDAVQMELERRKKFRERHGIRTGASAKDDPFYSKVFCGSCGGKLIRKDYKGIKEPYWKCENTGKQRGHKCKEGLIREGVLKRAVTAAWNQIDREKKVSEWNRMAVEGNALEKYRARLMLEADEEIEEMGDEMTRLFLEEVICISQNEMIVRFLDGSEERVEF